MFGKLLSLVTVGSLIALILVFQSTDPNTSGPVGILAVFFLLYVFFLGCMTWILRGATWTVAQLARPILVRRPVQPLSLRHAYYLSSVLAMAPVMMIGMSSVGQLGPGEVVLVVLFVILGVFYVQKRI